VAVRECGTAREAVLVRELQDGWQDGRWVQLESGEMGCERLRDQRGEAALVREAARWAVRGAVGLMREAALARDAARQAVRGVVGPAREAALEREVAREAWVMEGGLMVGQRWSWGCSNGRAEAVVGADDGG